MWLNEGFASFMENIGTKAAEPGWAMEEQFLVDKMQPALALDALLASHPISTPVKDPAQIESIFDTISYKKVKGKLFYRSFGFRTVCLSALTSA